MTHLPFFELLASIVLFCWITGALENEIGKLVSNAQKVGFPGSSSEQQQQQQQQRQRQQTPATISDDAGMFSDNDDDLDGDNDGTAAWDTTLIKHGGGCHCQAVRFEFVAPRALQAWECNCSICAMKKNIHIMVPAARFTLLTPTAAMSTYQFGTKTAKHTFCSTCGIASFYTPRSNPDGVGVTVHCIDPGTVQSVEVKSFDGLNWERDFKKTGISQQTL